MNEDTSEVIKVIENVEYLYLTMTKNYVTLAGLTQRAITLLRDCKDEIKSYADVDMRKVSAKDIAQFYSENGATKVMSVRQELREQFAIWQEKMNMHEFVLEHNFGKVRIIKYGMGDEQDTLMADNGEFHDMKQFLAALKIQNSIGA